MTNEHTPPDLPPILPVTLAERTAQKCFAHRDLDITAAAIAAEMRALMHDAEGPALETMLTQQSQLLNLLFHRTLGHGTDTEYLMNRLGVLNLALTAQRECRQTVETLSRARARRHWADMQPIPTPALPGKQTDSPAKDRG